MKLTDLTDDVLFADVWDRPDLSPRDRSLITVAALVALGRDARLTGHLRRALDNGLTPGELAEAITHLAFYASWPAAHQPRPFMIAVSVPLRGPGTESDPEPRFSRRRHLPYRPQGPATPRRPVPEVLEIV
ncbi:carboxymuconolactone decarboxylase family protein [Streptomyces sp. tea 10]|nr:carboxymuconolactone decarboxylase family protein [Streptomyces sp. tea 10]